MNQKKNYPQDNRDSYRQSSNLNPINISILEHERNTQYCSFICTNNTRFQFSYNTDYNIIKDYKEFEMITNYLKKEIIGTITYDLIFKAKKDGDSAQIFHSQCDYAPMTLVVLETGHGFRFGGFTSRRWEGNNVTKKDDNAYLFSINSKEIFPIKKGEDSIGCCTGYGPVFCGCQIRVYDKFFINGGTTYKKFRNYLTPEDYILSGGYQKFSIRDLEVYEVVIKK